MRLLILLLLASQCFGAFLYRVTYTPASSQVSNGPHSNFTVRISVSAQNWAKAVGSGGQVQHASAYDVVPITSSDCDIANKHAFKRISWDGTAGNLELDVFVSSFAQSTNIYVCVNDSSISADQQTSGSIDSTVKYRFDMEDNAANTTVVDSTTTANGTNAANTSGKTTTGRIGKALTFNGSTDYVAVTGSTSNDLNVSNTTVCFWAKATSTAGVPVSRLLFSGGTGKGYAQFNDDNWYSGQGSAWTTATASRQTDGAWHYYCWTYDASNVRSYRNGTLVGGPTALTSAVQAGNTENLNFGRDNRNTGGSYFTGDLDEIYKADAVRSADWLTTEYNMGTQSSFWSVSEWAVGAVRRRMIIQ